MLYIRFPLSLRNVEDLLHERGIYICHETVRFWWNRFGPMFAAEIRRQRVNRMRTLPHWRRHLDEVYVKINGLTHHLWRAVDHEGEVLEAYVSKTRDRKAPLKFPRTTVKCHSRPHVLVIDKLRSYGAGLKNVGLSDGCGHAVPPRKSQATGLRLIKNFLRWTPLLDSDGNSGPKICFCNLGLCPGHCNGTAFEHIEPVCQATAWCGSFRI
jgi:transposase-like protein